MRSKIVLITLYKEVKNIFIKVLIVSYNKKKKRLKINLQVLNI